MTDRQVERRVVTALFVDLVGSTALTTELGPERAKRALDAAFRELAALIGAEGGTVEKYVGDAIHALFGAPTAHPDDPVRALRAAQGCVRWTAARDRGPVPLALRVGVETGEAVVDLGEATSAGQQMSVGACVNLAARLQQLAEPGQVLVGPTCHEAVAEAGEFSPLGERELKGLGRIPVWRLVALGPPRPGARTPFVGREPELDLLRLAYRRARSGRSVLALVSGPPGQGKTRLAQELVTGLAEEAEVLMARCRPPGEPGARSPLQELLAGSDREATVGSLAESLARLFADADERRQVLTVLAHSAGLAVSPELAALPTGQRQDEIANGWRRYLGALARERPLVCWLDDLHWAEAEVVQLLDRLTFGGGLPVLVLATARPEFAAGGGLRSGGDRFFVAVEALDEVAARALARHAGNADSSAIARAQGNPLFILELARARSVTSGGDVPVTLQGMIGARLDELPPPDRELLQRASVVGETFTARDAALLTGREPGEVARALDRLADLLYVQPVAGGQRFHHALVRDVAYGRLTAADRMRLHARYAQQGVPPEDAEALAHHLWEAVGTSDADWVWEEGEELAALRARALAAQLAAARRYADRLAYGLAVERCRRALRFVSGPRDEARVEQALAEAHGAAGGADEAWAHGLRARDVYRELGTAPPPDFYPGLLERPVYTSGMFRQLPADSVIEALIDEGEAVARGGGDTASLARLLALRAYRSHDAARLEEALRLSEEAPDPGALVALLAHAAILQNRVGEFAVARRTYTRLDAVAPATGGGDALAFRAILALNTGHLGEAERVVEQYVAASAARGPHLQSHALREQCHVLLARGDWGGLVEAAGRAERLVAAHPDTAFCYAITTALGFAAIAHAVEGRHRDARALLAKAEAPLQAEPLERESVLLLARGAVGERGAAEALRREVGERPGPVFWFFHRIEAVVLAMLEHWDALDAVLPRLERVGERESPYLEALGAALREEMAAARGGPVATHRRLRELGYRGWSRLLGYRPPAR